MIPRFFKMAQLTPKRGTEKDLLGGTDKESGISYRVFISAVDPDFLIADRAGMPTIESAL